MSLRSILLGGLALVAIGLGAVWLLQGRPAAPEPPPAQPVPELPVEPEPLPSPALSQTETRTQAPTADPPATWTPTREDLVDAHWVEGRVLLPAALPTGEWVTLETLGRAFPSGSRHRVILGNDGAFRLAFPKGSSSGKVHLENRFLALEDPTISLPRRDGALELRPELCGVLKGRIVLGPIAEPRRRALDGMRLKVWSKSWSESPARGRTPQARLDEEGRFEFDRVPAAPDWEFSLPAGEFAEARRTPIAIVPGQVVELDVETKLLAVLRGVVVDPAGKPLSSASFEYAIRGTGEPRPMSLKPKSGADGTFEQHGIPLGPGWLVSSLTGYVTRSTQLTELAEGQVVEGLEIVLERGQAITGKLSWPDGAPAVGAEVSALFLEEQELGDTKRSVLRSPRVKTGEAGTFRLEGLPENALRLIATAADRERPEAARWNAVVELDALPPSELALVLARPCTIRGRVHDGAGHAPPNFNVLARPLWRLRLSDGYSSISSPEDSKSADGSFVIGGLLPTTYEVTASVSGLERSSPQRVELPGTGQPIEVVVGMPGMASGVVVDPAGNAVAGARVNAGDVFPVAYARCDAAGRFRFENLTPGSRPLVASAKGWAPSLVLQIAVDSNSPVEGLVLQLRTPGRIAGEVLDAQGRAEADRPVRIDGPGPVRDARTDASGRFLFEDLAADEYSLWTRATEAELAALPKNSSQRWRNSNDPVPREAHVKLGEGESARVVLRPVALANPILVKGRVLCSGKPVEGCEVAAWPLFAGGDGSPAPATSAADGRFQFQVDGAGPYSFSLDPADDSAQTHVRVSIEARSIVELVLELPAGRIAGIVVDREGRRVGRASLELRVEEGRGDAPVSGTSGSIEADAQGRFEFIHLAPATYVLTATSGRDAPTKHGKTTLGGLVVREGAALEGVKLVMLPGCCVEGFARRPDGLPAAGAVVRVRDESGAYWPRTWSTDSAGKFLIEGLPPGRYRFQALAEQRVSQESDLIALAESAPTKLELAMENATELFVEALNADGKPFYLWVVLVDARGRSYVGHPSDWDGAGDKPHGVSFEPAPPGTYTLRGQWPTGRAIEREVRLSGERTLRLSLRESD